jgi:malonate transporter MadL subunit
MVIYGVALLSLCYFLGIWLGDILGVLLNVKANVGGVGFAMLFLIIAGDYLHAKGKLPKSTADGVAFWSSMYIPIIVAMAAQQNVIAAIKGGPLALLAGAAAVAVAFAFVPVLAKITKPSDDDSWKNPGV